jgi:hypothetical protein
MLEVRAQGVGFLQRARIIYGFVAAIGLPAVGFAQGLIGKWREDFDGFPAYFIFTDCGVLEIQYLGASAKATFRVKDKGPPLKLEICPPDGKEGSCGGMYAYIVGDSLQLIADTDRPGPHPELLGDVLLQRVTDEFNDAHCKAKAGE